MPAELDNLSAMTACNSASGEASVSGNKQAALEKKKRNLPGMPDPEAEVIALSPGTLVATNRFVCEICNKGFQRDQNLQLHRRGHNLPWKLRQRTGTDQARKRVYVCPEVSCVHHDPARALGDLTGIKKHFSRKHGEKKWKCDKCSKKYAVQSDWKAHSKTCGTREYRCDCGTLFSRRDSFITHRAFCDALVEEGAKGQNDPTAVEVEDPDIGEAAPPQVHVPEGLTEPPGEPVPLGNSSGVVHYLPQTTEVAFNNSTSSLFSSLFASAATSVSSSNPCQSSSFPEHIGPALESPALCLASRAPAVPIFSLQSPATPPSPYLSATALLQKAAQIGPTTSSSSFLRGFGFSPSTFSDHLDGLQGTASSSWRQKEPMAAESDSMAISTGHENEASGLHELMMSSSSSLFSGKPATLDLLGLGLVPGGSARSLSALITSNGGGLHMGVDPTAAFFVGGSP